MEWANPGTLLLLWLLPVAYGLRVYAARKRDVGLTALLGSGMQARLAPSPLLIRRHVKAALLTIALGAVVCALARPRWGIYYEDVEARGVDLFVLVDTSRSMLADDVRPNRLERARADVRDFASRVQGDRIGLIAFAGAAVVKCPLTLDATFFELALSDLDVTSAPRGGTHIGDAIRVAMRSFSEESSERTKLILLITDGDDQDSYPLDAAAAAAEQGIQIIAVGLGDPGEGSLIPAGDGTFVTHEGEHVRSRLNLNALEEITRITGGVFVPAGIQDHDLAKVYDEHVADLLGEEATGDKRARRHERFQWFVALALFALLADIMLPCNRPPLALSVADEGEQEEPARS